MELGERELKDWEVKILDSLEVDQETRSALRRHWENMPVQESEPIDEKKVKKYTLSAYFLTPLMLLVLGANLAYGIPLLSKLSVLVVLSVWVLYIFLCSVACLFMSVLVVSERIPPLNQGLVAMYKSKNSSGLLYRLYNHSCNVALVVLLALNGYLVTAVMIATVLLCLRLVAFLARAKVRAGLVELMKTA